jgi:iron complex transport system permease protein
MTSLSAGADRSRPALAAFRRPAGVVVIAILVLVLLAVVLLSSTVGAAGIPLHRLLAALGLSAGDPALVARDQLVLWSVRLPRIALVVMVGAMLAVAGAAMQGLFRNPLADPALVGVSNGAALAAAGTIVLADRLAVSLPSPASAAILPIAAFAGALATTVILYRISTRYGRTSIAIFLLGGLAIAAMTNAGTGLLVYLADDRQLRDINFWMLGSLGGATWTKAGAILPFLVLSIAVMPVIARGLDLLSLGESEAFHAGIAVEWLKRFSIVLIAAAVGAAVAVSGVIGFVGIVVPHLIRTLAGPGHRVLLPASALLGAALLLAADTAARMIVAPAELPIGIVTAVIGAPFFLALLLRQRALVGL